MKIKRYCILYTLMIVQCHCLLANGPNKGTQCPSNAKFPEENPLYCGRHTNCSKPSDIPQKPPVKVTKILVKPAPIPEQKTTDHCRCLLVSGKQCTNKAKNPPHDPIYCGVHKNCQRPIKQPPIKQPHVDQPAVKQPPEKMIHVPIHVLPPKPIVAKLMKIPKNIRMYAMNELTVDSVKTGQTGTYGEAIWATLKATGQQVVLKKYSRPISSIDHFSDKLKEIFLLQHLNQYPQAKVVKLHGICINGDILYLVMERLDKNLSDISVKYALSEYKNYGILPHREYKVILYKLLQAFDAIHSLGVIHNDIKLPNIMLLGNDIRIIDFGISEFVGIGPTKELMSKMMVTEVVKAPDASTQSQFIPTNRKTYASDVYSIGATMIHMIIREYKSFHIDMKKKQILRTDTNKDIVPDIKPLIDDLCVDLLLKMMNPDTHKRFCCHQALLHPYFNDINTLLQTGIDRNIVGGGNYITDVRMSKNIVSYTQDEFTNKSMDLCYLEAIHQNYADDQIPVTIVNNKDIYNKVMVWILTSWNSNTNAFTVYDSIINGQLMIKNLMDEYIQRKGNSEVQGLCTVIHSIYDSVLIYYGADYDEYSHAMEYEFTSVQLQKIVISELLVHNNVRFDFIPVWCHIVYMYLKIIHEIKDIRLNKYGNLLQEIGKWVLFYFIQSNPFGPLTTWDLVKYCTIHILSRSLSVSWVELIKNPIAEWLTIPEPLYDQLEKYYNDSIIYMRDNVLKHEKSKCKPITELYFSP